MPCAHKVPSQHLREYLFLSLHKQPRVEPGCGAVRDGVFQPFNVLFGLLGLFQLLIVLLQIIVLLKVLYPTPRQSIGEHLPSPCIGFVVLKLSFVF